MRAFRAAVPVLRAHLVRPKHAQMQSLRMLLPSAQAPLRLALVQARGMSSKSPMEIEKELFIIKRDVSLMYRQGNYDAALERANELKEGVKVLFGETSATYASAESDIGLMLKMTGDMDGAIEHYTKALHIYEDTVGRKHKSYYTTLTNLGIVYKEKATQSTGIDKRNLLERAEEAFGDAVSFFETHSPESKERVLALSGLATITVMDAHKREKARELMLSAIDNARQIVGPKHVLTALAYHNMGYVCKCSELYNEAEAWYNKALDIRNELLGPAHTDSIVTRHNLAENYMAAGREAMASEQQEKILEILGVSEEDIEAAAREKEEDEEREGKGR